MELNTYKMVLSIADVSSSSLFIYSLATALLISLAKSLSESVQVLSLVFSMKMRRPIYL